MVAHPNEEFGGDGVEIADAAIQQRRCHHQDLRTGYDRFCSIGGAGHSPGEAQPRDPQT